MQQQNSFICAVEQACKKGSLKSRKIKPSKIKTKVKSRKTKVLEYSAAQEQNPGEARSARIKPGAPLKKSAEKERSSEEVRPAVIK